MSRPYRLTVTGDNVHIEDQFANEGRAYILYCKAVLAHRGRDVTVTLTYTPPGEKGMFGIRMPTRTIASATHRRRR